jgi:hypothetical protein
MAFYSFVVDHEIPLAYERPLCGGRSIGFTESKGTDKRSNVHGKMARAFFRRNLDHQISKSPKPVLRDDSGRTPNGKPIVIAPG